MKIQIIYSSLSGNTERLAKEIGAYLGNDYSYSIHNLRDGIPQLDGDIFLLGYWVDKAAPDKKMKDFMETLEGKTVGLFCTLGYYADAAHAQNAIINGTKMVANKNTIIGTYVCNGAISDAIIKRFRKNGTTGRNSATPENEIRWEVLKDHPTKAECQLAGERFYERVKIYEQYVKQGLDLKSILPYQEEMEQIVEF